MCPCSLLPIDAAGWTLNILVLLTPRFRASPRLVLCSVFARPRLFLAQPRDPRQQPQWRRTTSCRLAESTLLWAVWTISVQGESPLVLPRLPHLELMKPPLADCADFRPIQLHQHSLRSMRPPAMSRLSRAPFARHRNPPALQCFLLKRGQEAGGLLLPTQTESGDR